MTTNSTSLEKKNLTPAENQKAIENHKKAAAHLDAAAKEHLEAAKHYEAGNHEKAAQSAALATGHQNLANDTQKEKEEVKPITATN